VLFASGAVGTSEAVPGPPLYVTFAGTGLPPEVGVTVNVDDVTVAVFIGSLNVTTTLVFTATPLAAFSGVTFITVGGVTSAIPTAVVNVEEKAVSALFATSFAPVVTFTV
jgi:hypothetical protein